MCSKPPPRVTVQGARLEDTGGLPVLTRRLRPLTRRGSPGRGSYVEGSASCPAAPLLHGGQVMSQCCSPEEHHAGQPARPQSSARRRAMMQLWVPQKAPRSHGHWEGGSGGRRRAAFCRERFGKQQPGTGRDGAPNAAGPKGMGSIDNVLVTSLKREYWWCCLAVFPF